jgi:MFS family permease
MKSNSTGSITFVLFATGVTAIGGFLFGYDTAVINGANSFLKDHFQLTDAQLGAAGASAILGCIPGAMFAGFLSDRFGRKRMLFLCALLYAISGVLSAIPATFWQFLVARLISGLGIGASSMICPVYIAEIAPEKWRGRLGSLFQLGIVTGIFLTLFINMLIQNQGDGAWNVSMGWRWMLGMEVVPAVFFIGLLFTVPESPRWLAQRGREPEARDILARVGGADHAESQLQAIRRVLGEEQGSFSELFKPAFRRPLALAVVLMAFSQFCGINAIIYYSTPIFEVAGKNELLKENSELFASKPKAETEAAKEVEKQKTPEELEKEAALQAAKQKAAFEASVWIGLVNLLFTFLAIGLVDKLGRKPLLIVGAAIQAVSLSLVGWMLYRQTAGIGLLVCIITFTAAFAMSMGPIGWIFCSEVFPGKIRGRAMSIATMVVWISCYIVAQTFPMLSGSEYVGPAKTFWVYAIVSAASCLFALFFIPETKGKTLEEIESYWMHGRK